MNCDFDLIDTSNNKLLEDFVLKYKLNQIKPDVIVDYKRLAYTYDVEDVRVTFDENIKSNESVLEVKFNNYIPNHIAKVIMTIPSIRLAVSKFALCKEQKEV